VASRLEIRSPDAGTLFQQHKVKEKDLVTIFVSNIKPNDRKRVPVSGSRNSVPATQNKRIFLVT
jgi:hypothetical protein